MSNSIYWRDAISSTAAIYDEGAHYTQENKTIFWPKGENDMAKDKLKSVAVSRPQADELTDYREDLKVMVGRKKMHEIIDAIKTPDGLDAIAAEQGLAPAWKNQKLKIMKARKKNKK